MNPHQKCDALARLGVERGGMLARLGRFWTMCKANAFLIRDIHENLVPLKPNLAQAMIHLAMMEQAARGEPIRLTILKARKEGASTWIQVWYAYLCAYYPNQNAVTIAHTGESTNEIFDIARRAASHHTERKSEVLYRAIRWDDESKYYSMTAGGAAVGAGGTPSAVHLSEGPKWERNKRETFYNILNALPLTPTSCAICEFTAKGRELFFDHWEHSRNSSEGYTALFLAWYLDDRLVVPVTYPLLHDEEEIALVARAKRDGVELTDEMLQWRRLKIAEIGADMFRQEFPSTPEEAVQAAEGLVLPGLRSHLFTELPFLPASLPRGCMVGGIDFGYADAQVQWSGYLVSGELWLTSYYRRVEGLAADHIAGIEPGTLYYCDPAALTARKELANACSNARIPGVSFVLAPRKRITGEDIVANELRTVIKFIGEGRLHIAESISENLIIEADSYVWDEKTGKPKTTRSDQTGHFDSIDALRYLIMGIAAPSSKPTGRIISKGSRRSQFAGI